jgi:hypothetical protein
VLKGDGGAPRVKSSSLRSKGFLLRRACCAASSDADVPLERRDGAPMAATENVLQLLNGMQPDGQSSPPVLINGQPLYVLAKEAAALYPDLKDVHINPAIVRGAPLYERFAAAMEAAGDERRIEILLHGTPEQNVDSILTTPLRACPHENARWFSNCMNTAWLYACGAHRQVIFAVLNPKQVRPSGYRPSGSTYMYNSSEETHHLPLFVARWK